MSSDITSIFFICFPKSIRSEVSSAQLKHAEKFTSERITTEKTVKLFLVVSECYVKHFFPFQSAFSPVLLQLSPKEKAIER